MNFFVKLKSYFNKNISILPYQKTDMVSFVKLRNNSIKINSSVEVEDNYNFVIVYYNKVCDIISSGSFKLNEDSIPKLFRFSKTPFGLSALTTTSIICDAYYVNLNMFENNNFKTQDKITALSEGQKVKIKLDGTFNMKVCDTLKFMKALCNDYAVIKNKKTINEICSTVGFEVSKVLNTKNFSVDDYIFNKDKIITTLEELVNNHTKSFGIEVSSFNINNIIVNKKYLNEVQLTALEQIENLSKTEEIEVAKVAEVDINNSKEKYEVVYAGKNEKQNSNIICDNLNKNLNEVPADYKKNIDDNKEVVEKKYDDKKIESDKNDIIIKDLEITANKILENPNHIAKVQNSITPNNISENSTQVKMPKADFFSQPEPQIIGFGNEENLTKTKVIKKDKLKINENKVSKTKEKIETNKLNEINGKKTITSYKICACCGSKNSKDEKICSVCKSMLD